MLTWLVEVTSTWASQFHQGAVVLILYSLSYLQSSVKDKQEGIEWIEKSLQGSWNIFSNRDAVGPELCINISTSGVTPEALVEHCCLVGNLFIVTLMMATD